MALSSSGSTKRACALVNNAVQTAICVVDGCAADLSNSRKYYLRHKVCEVHSKSPQVSIHGQKLRFCQQCSRFHSLDEFDEGKRSCRKRLDGHNRRRRKPRPYLFSPHHGTNMFQSAGPPVHPTMALLSPRWSGGTVAAPPWVDHTNYAPSLLSSLVSPPQSSCTPRTHEMHPQSGSGSGSGSITTGPLDRGLSYGGLDDCDMGWGGMTDIDPRHCASLDHQGPQTHPFYWQ